MGPTAAEQQLLDRAGELTLPRVLPTDEFMRLARRDPAAALTQIERFGRAFEEVRLLVADKAQELVASGEYEDDPGRAEDDAQDWLSLQRPDLLCEEARVAEVADYVVPSEQ